MDLSTLLPLNAFADFANTLMMPIYWAVSGLLVLFHKLLSPVFGFDSGITWTLAILLLTAVVRILILPLYTKQLNSSRAMQSLQPKMKALQDKYKDDKERLGQETMKLYESEGVSPTASCLPLLVQMPIFLGLFYVLNGVARGTPKGYWLVNNPVLGDSLRQASIFGAELSGRMWPFPESGFGSTQAVALVLLILMMGALFFQQLHMLKRNTPPASLEGTMGQQMKMMLYVMPLTYVFVGPSIPIGVLLYWATSNLWTMVQQWWVIRSYPTPGTPAYIEWEERMKAKGKDPRQIERDRVNKGRKKPVPATDVSIDEPGSEEVAPIVKRQGAARQVVRKDSTGGKQIVQRAQPKQQNRSQRKKPQ